MASPTQSLLPPCPPLLPGGRLSRPGGGEGFKLLALEAQGAGLNVYRAYDLQASRRCPACANGQPAGALRCAICQADLADVAPGHATVMLYEACMPDRLAPFQWLARQPVRHPHLLLPVHAQDAPAGGPMRSYLALPESPAPVLADQARPHGLLAVLRWGEQLAGALAALHGAGLVHGQVDDQHVRLREERAWLVCAPGQALAPAGASAGGDARDLARVLLRSLSPGDGPVELMSLPAPLRAALTPALSGALADQGAAASLAGALAAANAALRRAGQARSAAGWASHPGAVRLGNEDSLLLWQMEASLAGVRTPFTLALVADGAGGHAGGEIASQAAVQVVAAQLAGSLLPGLAAGRLPDPAALRLAAVAALQAANAELRRLRQQRGNDMLTTSVLALCVEQRALVANVGDSRAYLVRAGRLRQVSEDHTLVARLLRLGQLTPEEARSHARRHQLYRALGHDQDVEVDLFELDVQPGDLLLLCSDGLTEEVGEAAIGHILAGAADLDAACRALTEAAVAAGGRDNVSVILARPLG